jgi:hypothetical protein
VDTVHFSFDVEISQDMWERLDAKKELAQEIKETRKAEHAPEWLGAVMCPTGANGG